MPTPPGQSLRSSKTPELGQRNPNTVATFENAWEQFVPFLAFPPEVRRVIYTTNSIESLNFQPARSSRTVATSPTTKLSSSFSSSRSATSKAKGHQTTEGTRPTAQRTQSPRPPARGTDHDELEEGTRPTHISPSRPIRPLPVAPMTNTAYDGPRPPTQRTDRLANLWSAARAASAAW